MNHEEYCPITLEQNKRWFESISPYCNCNKTSQNIRPEIPQCSAPEPLKNCSLDIIKVEKLALSIVEKYAGGRAKAFIELRDEIMKLQD